MPLVLPVATTALGQTGVSGRLARGCSYQYLAIDAKLALQLRHTSWSMVRSMAGPALQIRHTFSYKFSQCRQLTFKAAPAPPTMWALLGLFDWPHDKPDSHSHQNQWYPSDNPSNSTKLNPVFCPMAATIYSWLHQTVIMPFDFLFWRCCLSSQEPELAVQQQWACVWAHPFVFPGGFFCKLHVYT